MSKKKVKSEAPQPSNPYFRMKPSGVKGGRPRKVLNDEGVRMVRTMASIGCTIEEIAAAMNVSPNTFDTPDNREVFEDAYNKGRESSKTSVRKALYQGMMKGNMAATIFLAKNVLGMSNNPTPPPVTTSPVNDYTEALQKVLEDFE